MNYKNIRSVLLVWIAAGVVSCHGDLDIMQENKLSVSNMWKTSIQVENSTYGIYSAMRDNFVQDQVNVLTWGELRVGEYMWRNSRTEMIWLADLRSVVQNTMSSTTDAVSWSKLYTAIDQANAVLKYAPAVAMTDTKRSWAIGQAAFARAYLYFWAVRLWGDVPLNLNPIESVAQPEAYPSRAPKASVYAQIGTDIDLAVKNAGSLGTDKYLATADAVNMLKAEYALWMYAVQNGGDNYLTMAGEALAAIGIKAGDNRLLTDYAKIFDGYGSNNKNSNEVVFALYNSRDENKTGGFSTYFAFSDGAIDPNAPVTVPTNTTVQYLDYGDEYLELLHKSQTENNDMRVKTNLGEGPYGRGNKAVVTWPNKFIGNADSSPMIRDCDILYYRYALAVMLDAELKYYRRDYTGALASLNIIAKRAYGKENFYTSATQSDVLKALCNEYLLEFPCEGVVWWALIRLDRIWEYNADLKARKDAVNILLWPISKSARDKNSNLAQTEGWY